MILFSTALSQHKLSFKKLSDSPSYLSLAATWAENEWGYIRNKGIEYRQDVLRALSDQIYLGFFASEPIAMFALLEQESSKLTPNSQSLNAYELMYVYVDKDYRGMGFGKQILDAAKQLAAHANANLILLDTLKPALNHFYEKNGADFVCEGRLFSHPTDILSIKI